MLIVCVLRIIILIVVHVDPVALIERADAFLVLSINLSKVTINSCYYSTNTDPLVNRRVAGVGFLMEAFECAESASSAWHATDEGGVVSVVAYTHSVYC